MNVLIVTGKLYLFDKGYEIKMCSASDEETITKEVVDCDAILVRTAKITRKIMEAGKSLKVIARHGVGVDTPATNETRNSIDMKYLKLMKKSAYLINTARGEIINEKDLYKVLVNKSIKGAALDVLSSEPPDKDNYL